MANYYGSGRTNYFAVTDLEGFKADISKIGGAEVVSKEEDGKTLVAILSENEGGFCWDFYNEETEDYEEVDWAGIFKAHLEEGWVAVIQETGAEKLRYLAGYAIAFNSKGESVSISLDDIYEKAKSLGSNISHATY